MRDYEPRNPDQAIRRRAPRPAEADRVDSAGSVAPGSTAAGPAGVGPDAAAILRLQRSAGNAGVVQMLADEDATSPVHDVIGRGGGSPLDGATRSSMESQMGHDFGDVRVHTDARASASAEAVGANAYTVGNDIAFRSGHFDPATPTGQRTIAHELTHVVQQRSGPVDGSDAAGGIRLSDPGDRFEQAADETAEQVVPTAQRQTEMPEEEEMQL